MAVHNDYAPVIEAMDKTKNKFVLTQEKMKKLTGGEVPKSMFKRSYITNGSNELARFIMKKGYKFEVVESKIIVYKK
jgi:outer membrane protein assembly factor BamA